MEKKDESGEAPPRPDAEAPARRHQPLSEALSRLYQGANPGDAAPGGIGEFALARSNPVPVASLEECRRYLGRLRRADGERIVWTHSGTIAVGLNGKPVLQYAILSLGGQTLTTLYLSPGYAWTSAAAPRGFLLEP
jgi:hypothetical protein